MKVRAYYNLHRHCWSVQALEGEHKGRVIGHAAAVELNQFNTKVSLAGRERVLKERKKNVHAFIEGQLVGATEWISKRDTGIPSGISGDLGRYRTQITYNPYKYDCFVEVGSEHLEVTKGYSVHLSNTRKVYVMDHQTVNREPNQLELFA